MRFAVERVEEALNEQGEPDGHGQGQQWTASYIVGGRWLDSSQGFNIRAGEFVFVKGNFKKVPVEGTEEDFLPKTKKDDPSKSINFKYQWPDGNEAWVKVVGRVQQAQGGSRPNPYAGTKAPAKPASGAPTASTGHSHAAPTMSQAVAVFVDCATEITAARAKLPEGDRDLLGPGQITTLFLARLDGRVVRNPSAADIAAKAAAEAEALADAQAVIDAARAKLEAKAPGLTPPVLTPPVLPEDDDIPF